MLEPKDLVPKGPHVDRKTNKMGSAPEEPNVFAQETQRSDGAHTPL